MYQKNNKYKVLKIFFDDPNPREGFQLREISRKTRIAPTSVKRYLKEMEKENLIKKWRGRPQSYPIYFPNRDSEKYRFCKKIDIISRINESGILKCLDNNCSPDVVILFGSASRGEDIKKSDIDIFLLCKERKIDTKEFERELKRKINLFFCENFSKLSKELKNNILNGIILKGYLKVF